MYVFDFSVCFLTVVMLKWFVDAEVAAGAIEHPRKLIEEENVEVRQNDFLMLSWMRM